MIYGANYLRHIIKGCWSMS